MDNREAVNWLINILADIGKAEHSDLWHYEQALTEIKDMLESAQQEQIWTLCDEKMPEEHEWIGTKKFGTTISDEVYVTFENGKGERFCKHMTFQNGELSRYDKTYMDAWYKDYKPIAWIPLPEPYTEKKTKETNYNYERAVEQLEHIIQNYL